MPSEMDPTNQGAESLPSSTEDTDNEQTRARAPRAPNMVTPVVPGNEPPSFGGPLDEAAEPSEDEAEPESPPEPADSVSRVQPSAPKPEPPEPEPSERELVPGDPDTIMGERTNSPTNLNPLRPADHSATPERMEIYPPMVDSPDIKDQIKKVVGVQPHAIPGQTVDPTTGEVTSDTSPSRLHASREPGSPVTPEQEGLARNPASAGPYVPGGAPTDPNAPRPYYATGGSPESGAPREGEQPSPPDARAASFDPTLPREPDLTPIDLDIPKTYEQAQQERIAQQGHPSENP